MHPDAPYFIILLCLMPDDFTHQGEGAAMSPRESKFSKSLASIPNCENI